MLENLKTYFVEVIVKKYAPTLITTAVASGLALLATHQGMLESWGVTFGSWPMAWPHGQEPTGQVILIELDTFKTMAGAGLVTVITLAMAAIQHHGTAVVEGTPQSGDVRQTQTPPQTLVGGDRSTDVPKGAN